MTLRFRILLVLLAVLGASVTAMIVMRLVQRQEVAGAVASLQRDRSELLDQLLALQRRALTEFAEDYSQWDEMAEYVARPDPAWPEVNIVASLPRFALDHAWVLAADRSFVFTGARRGRTPLALPAEVVAQLARTPVLHGFFATAEGVVEVESASIHPSDDIARITPARGYLLVGRVWDKARVGALADLLRAEVKLLPPQAAPDPAAAPTLRQVRELLDVAQRPVAQLRVDEQMEFYADMLDYNRGELLVIVGQGLLACGCVALVLHVWVLRPLRLITLSLTRDRPDTLSPLRHSPDEFGRLAALVTSSAEIRAALREALEERTRLGRDLHDSIIQALYATGLRLMSLRPLLRTDPAEAEVRINQVRESLNAAIRELRRFIMGLEPETMEERSLTAMVAEVLAHAREVLDCQTELALDATLVECLPLETRLHLLQIVREAVSNALRHAQPRHLRVRLTAESSGRARLEIADDGQGFDPTAPRTQGHGLENLADRARDLTGTLHVDSAPRNGTRIQVEFPIPSGFAP